MRADAIGLFWEDLPSDGTRNQRAAVMPPIPDTGWQRPTYFPDLSRASVISIDCETWDPDLLTKGPGWARGVGHIVGVSIGADGGGRWYFPIRHEVEPEWNLDPDMVLSWLRDVLSNPRQPKVGANLQYDIGWLKHEGVHVVGELVDVQFAEALLDESAKVGLEILSQKYLGEGKQSNLLYQWCADYYGGNPTDKQRKNIYRSPPRLVGFYAESDADLPLRLAHVFYPLLARENLLDLFRMECDLIYLWVAMRFAGVRVDIPKAEELQRSLLLRETECQARLDYNVGFGVNVNAAESLAKAFDKFGVKYPRTDASKTHPNGQPSFTKLFMEGLDHPLGEAINEIRKLAKLRGTFVESYVLNSHINGMVYGQFHSMRGESGGTRSGRLSSSTPNLQNLPSRDEELAPMVRGIFVPDVGHKQWRKYDYSQIEYRYLVHFAVGPGAEEARMLFRANPDLDYHDMVQELIFQKTGVKLPRKPTKTINFGMIYGMGEKKLARSLKLDKTTAASFFGAYHVGIPFAKPTMKHYMELAQNTGIIETILGRKSRFDLWEKKGWANQDDDSEETFPRPYDQAIAKWAQVQRASCHKGLNRRLQGSAADLMKKAMHDCWRMGIFDYTGVPRLTVHDELDFSDPGGKDDGFAEMKRVMENAIPCSIPIKADMDIGPDWGHAVEQ